MKSASLFFVKVQVKICLVYLDDLIIFYNTADDHIRHVDEHLKPSTKKGVKLKTKMAFLSIPSILPWSNGNVRLLRDLQDKLGITSRGPPKFEQSKTKIVLRIEICVLHLHRRFERTCTSVKKLLNEGSPDSFIFDNEQSKTFDSPFDNVFSITCVRLPKYNLPYSIKFEDIDYDIGSAFLKCT